MSTDFATIILKADSSQLKEASKANQELAKSAETAEKATGKSTATNAKAEGGFKKLAAGIGLAAVAYKAMALAKESIALYEIQIQAEAKLEAVIRATGMAAGYTADELKKMASDLQGITNYGDETIINMQAVLLGFRSIKGDTFERTTKAILDMSSVMGTDLVSSAQSLGKALDSPTQGMSALSRQGFVWSDQQRKLVKDLEDSGQLLEAQNIILEEVEKAFGGVSEAMAKTPVGILQQQKNLLGDIKEEIGEKILPAQLEWNKAMAALVGTGLKAMNMWQEYATIIGSVMGGDSLRDARADSQLRLDLSVAKTLDKEVALSKLFDLRGKHLEELAKKQARVNELAEREKFLRGSDGSITPLGERVLKELQDEERALFNIQNRVETIRKEMTELSKIEPKKGGSSAPGGGQTEDEIKRINALMAEGARIRESMMNPMEKYAATEARLGEILALNSDFQETYNRAMGAANEELQKAITAEIDYLEKLEASNEAKKIAQEQALASERESLLSSLYTEEEAIIASYARREAEMLASMAFTEEEKTALQLRFQADRDTKLKALKDAAISQELGQYSALFGGISDLSEAFGGKQTALYKSMFAISKGFAIADSILKIQQGLAASSKVGFPQNILTMGGHLATTAGLIASIKSVNFAGSYARGGSIPAGSYGLVGEAGKPELVQGPAKVTGGKDTASMLKGSGTTINFYDQSGGLVETFRSKLRSHEMDIVVDDIAERIKARA